MPLEVDCCFVSFKLRMFYFAAWLLTRRPEQMPDEPWGIFGDYETSAQSAGELLALIVPAMFMWYKSLVREAAYSSVFSPTLTFPSLQLNNTRQVTSCWRIGDDSPQWSAWMAKPNLNDVWIMAIRRTKEERGQRVRYFPQVEIRLR